VPDAAPRLPAKAADAPGPLVLHASCVAWQRQGLLILGAAGSGKSALALQLIALGCQLVADDGTRIARADGGGLLADCPAPIAGRIEARFVGLLAVPAAAGPVRLAAAVDLDTPETERLPPERSLTLLGQHVPLILNAPGLSFAAALLLYLKGSRCA
jgi:HPr kinase/phosphorylase